MASSLRVTPEGFKLLEPLLEQSLWWRFSISPCPACVPAQLIQKTSVVRGIKGLKKNSTDDEFIARLAPPSTRQRKQWLISSAGTFLSTLCFLCQASVHTPLPAPFPQLPLPRPALTQSPRLPGPGLAPPLMVSESVLPSLLFTYPAQPPAQRSADDSSNQH